MPRRPKPPRLVDWDSFDHQYSFAYKDQNEALLQSGDPLWLDILNSQPDDIRQRILEGKVSLEEMEAQRASVSDVPSVPSVLEQNPDLTPEEAGVVAESQPIESRLEALGSHYSGARDVMGANADFQNLDSLRKYETPEVREKERARLKLKLSDPKVQLDISGASRNGLLMELQKIEEAERVFGTPGAFDAELQRIGSERILGGQEAKRAEEYYERTGNIGTRTVGDIASQPESAGSIVGGVAGSILGPVGTAVGAIVGSAPMAKLAYDAAYTEARLSGVEQKDAELFATAMSGTEYILEAMGGKVAGGASPLIKAQLKKFFPEIAGKVVTKAATAAAVGGAIGYAEEFGTSVIQDLGALGAADYMEDPKFRDFLKKQIARDQFGGINMEAVLSEWNRSGLAGGGQGAVITGTGGAIGGAIEVAKKEQLAVLNNTVGNEAAKARYAAILERANLRAQEIAKTAEAQYDGNAALPDPLDMTPLSDTTGPLAPVTPPPLPLTPEQRNAELKKKIEAMGTIPSTPRAPVQPRKGSAKPISPKGKSRVPLTLKPAPKASEEPSEGVPTQEELLKKIEGLKSERHPKKLAEPGRKSRNVIAKMASRGTADSDSFLDLINKGKMGIVDREADLPDGLEKGRDGWYDPVSKRVWLVAENLDTKTMRGTALHEINHFLNRNKKGPKSKTGITNLISGNLDTYNNRIKNLAKSGNKHAIRALERATADGNIDEELTSYFASEAIDTIEKKGVLGTAGQIFRDIKSAINTTARNKGIGELSDNDISYILRRQVEDAPDVDFTDGGDGLALDSIIGERSPAYRAELEKNPLRGYKGALDNRPRIEISDRGASVVEINEGHKEFLNKNGLSIKNILKHDDLYNAYPDPMTVRSRLKTTVGTEGDFSVQYGPIGHIKVKINKDLKDGMSYNSSTDTINISPSSVNSPNLKAHLLHELQHAVQARENFVGGANYHAILEKERQAMKNKLGVKELSESAEEVIRQRAWTLYDRAYGEAEARLSETNFAMTESELDENLPEDRFTERYWDGKDKINTKKLRTDFTNKGNRPLMRAQDQRPLPAGLSSIKPQRGGEFDPMFVSSLFNDFTTTILPDSKRRAPFERMIRNYLSRWAGTPDDPLRNVEHPLLGGYTWEEAWDLALQPASKAKINQAHETYEMDRARIYGDAPRGQTRVPETHFIGPKVPDDAPIWGGAATVAGQTDDDQSDSYDASLKIGEFLGHVGERLANVPEEELAKTDLIRAVRDTIAADEFARKLAEKQKAISDSRLKTYIQFPDGYRWVRLDSPGQFAAESDMMGHSVRGYEPSLPTPFDPFDWIRTTEARELLPNTPLRRTALNQQDRQDRDRDIAQLPEYKEYLETLTNDTDTREAGPGGHPSYGYGGWEAIKKDNARIYSLRDPKGKSVVTVELGKNIERPPIAEDTPKRLSKFEVSQIKGVYNNAPNESLHPKIRDLLRNLNEEQLLDLDNMHEPESAGLAMFNYEEGAHFIPIDVWNSMREPSRKSGEALDDFFDHKDAEIRAMPNQLTIPPTTKRVSPSGGLSSKARGFADRSTNVWDSTGVSIIKLLFDPNKGIGKQGLETRDYWRLKSAGYRDLAEGIAVRINHNLEKSGVDKSVFEAAVRKAEKQKTPVERERAMDALVRNYGEAGLEYRAGRNMIDNLSKQILKDWYDEVTKTGRKADKAELAVMAVIAENIGTYSTRVYLSDLPRMGTQYAKGIMKQYDKGDESDPYFQIVKDAVEFLIDHEVGIPDQETMLRRRTETIRRTYQTWIGKGDNLSKGEMINELLAKRAEITPKEIDNMVRKVVREMLGLDNPADTSPIATYYRGGALDKGILQARKKVPKELRRLMGEVTDPGQKIITTVSAQADLLYKNRMLNDFYDNGESKYWIEPGDRAKDGNEKFSEQLKGETYGPLDGKWVTKPFAYAIKSARTHTLDMKEALSLAGYDPSAPVKAGGAAVASTIGALSTVQKMSKTALDQGAWAMNAAGSWLALLKNGQVIGATKASREALRDALTLAIQSLGVEHKKDPETNKRLSVLLAHGIPDSVFTAELRDAEKEFYQKLLNDLNKDSVTDPRILVATAQKAWRGSRKGLRAARDIYGLLDSWVKIADFYGQVEYLTDYYNANGDDVSLEEIQREAADIVKFRNITYSRSPIAVQIAERGGATVFATFASEVVRTMVTTPYTVKMALDKAKNANTPEAKGVAIKEATKVGLGYLTAVSMIPALTHVALNSVFAGEDDEEKAKEDREQFLKLWFENDRDQSYYVLGRNSNGAIVLYNASRTDPHGHVTDFIRQIAQGDNPEEIWQGVKDLFKSPLGNGYMDDVINFFQEEGPKDSALADMAPGLQKEVEDMFENVDSSRAQADRFTRILDNFTPGAMRVINTEKQKVTENSQDAQIANAMAAMGMRMVVIDPQKIASFEAQRFNNERAAVAMKWNDLMNRENIEPEDVVRTALNIYTSEQEASRRLAEVYSGLSSELAGVNARKLLTELKVSPEDVNDAALGRFRSVVLSTARLRESENRQLGQAKTPEAKKRIRENYRLAREALRELELETR